MTPLEAAKQRLDIPRLAELRGWEWKPGRACRVPYRPDQKQSGSVLACHTLFHDFATGETLDAPALLSRVEENDNAAACRLFIELAGGPRVAGPSDLPRRKAAPARAETRTKPHLPPLHAPAREDLARVAALRRVAFDAAELAARRGFLFVAEWHGVACWALTDAARWLCQFRRMDGQLFARRDGPGCKAWTARGSLAAWPLGAEDAREFPAVALVEGGGDFLAAFHFILAEGRAREVAPVAMLGASPRLAEPALPLFRGKRVRIFPHVDKPHADGKAPGMEAAARWQDQLAAAGAEVECFNLAGLCKCDGAPVGDLNDATNIHPDDFEREPELAALMTF